MRIEYLADHHSHIESVAAWQQAEFGYLNPSLGLEQRVARLFASLSKTQLPVVLLALSEDKQALGSASIVASSMIGRPQLGPWLSSVVVPPAHRGKGVASALSLHAKHVAASLGFRTLALFTPHSQSLYARLGWHALEQSTLGDLPVTIMSVDLDA